MSFDGTQLKSFRDDLFTLLDGATWGGLNYGEKPRIVIETVAKQTGLTRRKSETLLIYSNIEKQLPYGHGLGVGQDDWMSDLSATIEVRTNVSPTRYSQLIGAVSDILKENVQTLGYVKIMIKSFKNDSGELRGSFKGIFTIEGWRMKPQFT